MSAAVRISAAQKIGKITATQWPMWGVGQPVTYRAENGLVIAIDHRDKTPNHQRRKALSIRTASGRLRIFQQMIVTDPLWQFERDRATRFVRELGEVIAEAQTQGDPYEDHGDRPRGCLPDPAARQPGHDARIQGDDHLDYLNRGRVLSRATCDL